MPDRRVSILSPAALAKVRFEDHFRAPRLETNRGRGEMLVWMREC